MFNLLQGWPPKCSDPPSPPPLHLTQGFVPSETEEKTMKIHRVPDERIVQGHSSIICRFLRLCLFSFSHFASFSPSPSRKKIALTHAVLSGVNWKRSCPLVGKQVVPGEKANSQSGGASGLRNTLSPHRLCLHDQPQTITQRVLGSSKDHIHLYNSFLLF